jgi:hydrogenase maturation protease
MIRILVAGAGNIFLGDDGFGVEVVRRLRELRLPEGVEAIDFGINGIDLTYALLDGCEAAVLVDAVQRGGAPGTLYLIEPDPAPGDPAPDELLMSGHDLDPAKVLRLVQALGGTCRRVLLLGCEPQTFGEAGEGMMGLSPPVQAAIAPALSMVERIVLELSGAEVSA